MKISFKHLILLFAVGMMSVVACSDDDSTDPVTPPAGGGGGSQPTYQLFAMANLDSINFSPFKAVLDTFNTPSRIFITGTNTSKSASINISFGENHKGTTDLSTPSSSVSVTFVKNSIPFSTKSGKLVVSQNDSVVAGTFYFEGNPIAGSDTLTVTDGKFRVRL